MNIVAFSKPAIEDFAQGLGRWRFWCFLGSKDVRQRYRRTVIGPFWFTLSMAIFIGALGVLYSRLWGLSAEEYIPFLCAGFVSWTLITTTIIESCVAFSDADRILKQISLPFSVFIFRVVWRNLLVFFHNVVVFVIVAVVFGIPPSWSTLLIIPGLFLICLNSAWIGILLGVVCLRFRDVKQIVASGLQILFFITPIFWTPSVAGEGRHVFIDANVFFHLVEIVRSPLLGISPTALTWYLIIGVTVLGWAMTIVVFSRVRDRIAYWL